MTFTDQYFESRIKPLGHERFLEDDANIQDRDIIVSGDQGMKEEESFSLLRERAGLLDRESGGQPGGGMSALI